MPGYRCDLSSAGAAKAGFDCARRRVSGASAPSYWTFTVVLDVADGEW